MGTILLASNNPGKLKELESILEEMGVAVVTPSELGLTLDVEETGETFAENAVLKAEAFSRAAGMPALADDSGLVIDALGGRPGIFSARYGGSDATDRDRCRLILEELRAVPDGERTARFVAAVAVAAAGRPGAVFEGRVDGFIAAEERGNGGFGYDPIFYYPPFGTTFADVPAARKAAVSHRGRALSAAAQFLRTPEGNAYT